MLSIILNSPITLSKKLILKINVDYLDNLIFLFSDVINLRHNIFVCSKIMKKYTLYISHYTKWWFYEWTKYFSRTIIQEKMTFNFLFFFLWNNIVFFLEWYFIIVVKIKQYFIISRVYSWNYNAIGMQSAFSDCRNRRCLSCKRLFVASIYQIRGTYFITLVPCIYYCITKCILSFQQFTRALVPARIDSSSIPV